MSAWLWVVLAATPLPFEEALARAGAHPWVEAAHRAQAQRQAGLDALGVLSANPSVQVMPGARFSSSGVGPEVSVQALQPLSLSGVGARRREAAGREVAAEVVLARVRLGVAERWAALWAAEAALRDAQQELRLAGDLLVRLEHAQPSGGVTRLEVASARAWRAEAELLVLGAEGEAFSAGVMLSRSLGLDAREPAQAGEALPEVALPDEATLAALVGQVEGAAQVRGSEERRQVELARAEEVRAANGAWLQVGAAATREGTGDVVASGVLHLTLPWFEQGQRERAAALTQAERLSGERLEAVAEARAERVEALHELEHTHETLEVVAQRLVPSSDEAAAAAQRRLEAGEGTAQEWVVLRRAAVVAHARLIRARADVMLARFHVAELARHRGGTP